VINAIHVDESHLQKPQQTFASLVKRKGLAAIE